MCHRARLSRGHGRPNVRIASARQGSYREPSPGLVSGWRTPFETCDWKTITLDRAQTVAASARGGEPRSRLALAVRRLGARHCTVSRVTV